ncbi:MAG: ribosomal RNA small subunit methyltransferase A [Alphaproteobacteria bacterium]|nr:ribosomal RNA small subunit methyltransferase A [Alphaproteobacteria bacterium]MBN2779803.1 ribosomal RNA small subunit methyltransferase A [Alphaproteobacteria bacterium]
MTILEAKKSLGQNFITDPSLLAKIAGYLKAPETKTVIEIGSGPCTLTQAILNRVPHEMIAIEKDDRTIPLLNALEEKYNFFSYQMADATKVDLTKFADEKNLTIIGNLPYNVSTVLLINWLKQGAKFSQAILMFQKEVAYRITAKPNTKDYGRLSILSQALCKTKSLMVLPPHVFKPAPKVDSALVELIPDHSLTDIDIKKLDKLSTLAFANRRKKVMKNIANLFENIDETFKKHNIDSNARAEDLTVEIFITLIKDIKK